MKVQESIQRAALAQKSGRIEEAAQLYRDLLEIDPRQHVAWHALGLIEFQSGNKEQGIACLRYAVQLCPAWPEALYNLGTALQAAGMATEAVNTFRGAVALNHEFAEAHGNLGYALQALGRLDDAVASYRRALAVKPEYVEAHNNLGNALQNLGQLEDAIASYRRALELKPDYVEAHNNLGNALQAQGKADEALACYQRALAMDANRAETHYNLGTALRALGKFDDAVAAYRRALELKPAYAEAHNNLGIVLRIQGKFDDALTSYDRALELNADNAEAHNNRSMLLLLRGEFDRGWPEYEWRWQANRREAPHFSQPRWDGSSLDSKTILLQAEQGLGDTIQFIRYADLLKKQYPTSTVVVECQRQLVRLLSGCSGIDQLIGKGGVLPRFDVHLPLLSLPRIVRTTLTSIPSELPYLFAESELVAYWSQWANRCDGLRIGINWEGLAGPGEHVKRNIPFEFFVELVRRIPGISLIGLQKGLAAAEIDHVSKQLPISHPGPDFDVANGAFMDTAAIMMNLDLVITSDTSIPHLAGALGTPVWLALPYASEWRWLLGRCESPWYPTMRLFRQKAIGDWAGVFEEIAAALEQRLKAGSGR